MQLLTGVKCALCSSRLPKACERRNGLRINIQDYVWNAFLAEFLQAKTDLEQAGEGRPSAGRRLGDESAAANVEEESERGLIGTTECREEKKKREKTTTTPTTGEKVRAALS